MSLSLSPPPSQTNRTISKVATTVFLINVTKKDTSFSEVLLQLVSLLLVCWHYFSSLVVDLVNTLHGQHVIDPRVQTNLVQQGHPRFLCRPIQLLYKV